MPRPGRLLRLGCTLVLLLLQLLVGLGVATSQTGSSFSTDPLLPTSIALVAASACNAGQALRPCTQIERRASGYGNRTSCPCPYIDGVTGGPGPVKSFYLTISHLIRPSRIANFSKTHVVVNGQIPGPTIDVNEGDWVEAFVTNAMDGVPTTIHWHGQSLVMTPFNDGVPSVTQCAIQPGATMHYAFRASNAGTFWYHGHMLEQYTEGLFGALIIRPTPGSPQALPAADNEVILMLQDYYNNDAHSLLTLFYLTPASTGIEPIPDAIAINGVFSQELFIPAARNTKTLFRVIGSMGFSMYTISIDGVNLEIVEVDSTAVVPMLRPYIIINVAQRLSFIVDWSTLPAALNNTPAVFMRVIADTSMYAVLIEDYIPPYEAPLTGAEQLNPNFYGIIQFSPLSAGHLMPNYTVPDTADDDQVPQGNWAPPIDFTGTPYAGIVNLSSLSLADSNTLDPRPKLPMTMPALTHQLYMTLSFSTDALNINRGHLNGITHTHNMEGGLMPELFSRSVYGTAQGGAIVDDAGIYSNQASVPGNQANSFGLPLPILAVAYSNEAHYVLPAGGVICILINSFDGGDHPFHIHGHTFWVIATSERPDAELAYAANYARRDTITIPANGWIKIAFIAENPGIWISHCHIEWHVATGLMVELFEGLDALAGMPVPPNHQLNCNLPPPGAAAFVAPNPYVDSAFSVVVGGEPPFVGSQPVVQTANCSSGQASRPCSLVERATTAWANATVCPCPYIDGTTGGPGPVKSFTWSIAHEVIPSLLDPGLNKVLFSINFQVPGPTLVVNEGDWLQITITNSMDEEDTMFNWHGLGQELTPFNDGTDTVTQCSLQPGNTAVFGLRANRAGTFFYRGSINQQDIDGLAGVLIVRAPPASPEALPAFDSEAVLLVSDFYSITSHTLLSTYYLTPLSGGLEPVPDAIVVNGGFSASALPAGYAASSLSFVAVPQHATTTLFHLVAANALTIFNISIDGVNLRVVEVDSTPVVPFVVPSLTLSTGQRVAFIVDWTLLPSALVGSNVYFRVNVLPSSYGVNITNYVPFYEVTDASTKPLVTAFAGVIVFGALTASGTGALPSYAVTSAVPAAPAISYAGTVYAGVAVPLGGANLIDARPLVALAMPNPGTHLLYALIDFANDAMGVSRGRFNGIAHTIDPTGGLVPGLYEHMIYGTAAGGAATVDPADYGLAAAPASGKSFGAALPAIVINYSSSAHYLVPSGAVLVLVLENSAGTRDLPIHVHGHTFWLMATSDRPDAEAAYAGNYLRRDVVVVPAGGWAKVAFVADNPGMWAVECAINWHVTSGLMLELLEAVPALAGLPVPASHRAACGLAAPSATPSPMPFSSVTLAPAVAASPTATPGTVAYAGILAVIGVPTWAFGDVRVIGLFSESIEAALAPAAAAAGVLLTARVKRASDIASGVVIFSEARRRTHGRSAGAGISASSSGVQLNFVVLLPSAPALAAVAAAVAAPAFGAALLQAAAAGASAAAPELNLAPFLLAPSSSAAQYTPASPTAAATSAPSLASKLSSLVVPLAAGLGGALVICGALVARYSQLRHTIWKKGVVVPEELTA